MVARVTSHQGIGPGTHFRVIARIGSAVIRYFAGPPHHPRATARNGSAVLGFLARPPHNPMTIARVYTGRFCVRFSANPYHVRCPRRGGSGAGWRGDACVALGGRVSQLHAGCSSGTQGDASVPTLLHTTPAPTRTRPFPKASHTKIPV
jgi:hypothetical protein